MHFIEKNDGSYGGLIINDIDIPCQRGFDPIAKIWSSVRKRNREKFGVDVTGLFIYDEERHVVSCSFYLNFGVLATDAAREEVEAYTLHFSETFSLQMAKFGEALNAFMDAENGLAAYKNYLENEEFSTKQCDKIFNAFLRSTGLKIKEDDLRKQQKSQRTQRTKN